MNNYVRVKIIQDTNIEALEKKINDFLDEIAAISDSIDISYSGATADGSPVRSALVTYFLKYKGE